MATAGLSTEELPEGPLPPPEEQILGGHVNRHVVIGGVVANASSEVGIPVEKRISEEEAARIKGEIVAEFAGGDVTLQEIWRSARTHVAEAMSV